MDSDFYAVNLESPQWQRIFSIQKISSKRLLGVFFNREIPHDLIKMFYFSRAT